MEVADEEISIFMQLALFSVGHQQKKFTGSSVKNKETCKDELGLPERKNNFNSLSLQELNHILASV